MYIYYIRYAYTRTRIYTQHRHLGVAMFRILMKFTRFLLAKTKRVRRYSSCHRFLTLSIPATRTFAFAAAKVQQKNDIRKRYVIFFQKIYIFLYKIAILRSLSSSFSFLSGTKDTFRSAIGRPLTELPDRSVSLCSN